MAGRSRGSWLPWAAAAATFAAGLVLTAVATTVTAERIHQAAHERAEQAAAQAAESLTTTLWPMEAFNQAVRAYVLADPVRHDDQATAWFMSSLFEHWRGFRSAALAPGNTVSVVVPEQGNEAVVGLRYADEPAQWPDVKRAMDAKESVLSGPVELVQGGQGLAYRTPIYLPDGAYWGLISSVVDLDDVEAVAAERLADSESILIRDVERGGAVVVGDAGVAGRDVSTAELTPLGRHWEVVVTAGPVDRTPVVVVAITGTLVAALLALLVFLLTRARMRSARLLSLLEGVTSQAPGLLYRYRTRSDGPPEMMFASGGLSSVFGEIGTGPDAYAAILRLVDPEDLPALHAGQDEALASGETWNGTFRLMLPDGRTRWIRTAACGEREANGDVVWSGWSGDITDEMAEQASLRVSASLFAATRDGVIVLDADRRVTDVNAGLTSMMGFTRDEVVGRPLSEYVRGIMADESIREFWSQLDRHGYWRGELTGRDIDGRIRTSTASATGVRDDTGRLSHYLIVLDDMNIARDDNVTGLPGARVLDDEFRVAMSTADESGGRAALIVVGLEQFRQVNESFGHRIGDAVLRVVGQRLRTTVPPATTVVRLRGDEFGLLLSTVDDLSVVDRYVRSCLDAVSAPIEIDRLVIRVGARAGVTVYPDDPGGPSELAAHANQAMRAATPGDLSSVVYFSAEMKAEETARTLLVEDLLRAVRSPAARDGSGEFSLVLQPVVDLASGEVHKAEALVRWNHPERGPVRPDEFIPVAEETGLITDLGDVVFAAAVRAASTLRGVDPSFRVGFNLSPIELRDGSDRHALRVAELGRSGVPGDALVAEITEGALLSRNPTVEANLQRYQQAGVLFAIDDFGTGYSSLAYLRDLDVDYLKVDRTFIDRIQPGGADLALVHAIVAMAHTMRIEVIAEGVETAEQSALLGEAGCDYVQGYWHARPMLLPDLLTWMAARRAGASS